MDYGLLSKMVQADLCKKGLTAASVEAAPMLVESFLKNIGLKYTKDDVTIIAQVMTSGVAQITPCNPGSAPAYVSGCDCGCQDDDKASELFDEMDELHSALGYLVDDESSVIADLAEFQALAPRIADIIKRTIDEGLLAEDIAEVTEAVTTIKHFLQNFDAIKELVEDEI
jgi:hypothetical protein